MMLFHRHDEVRIQNARISSRRSFVQSLPFAALAFNSLRWREAISLYAADSKRQDRACILLWMQGGPSQFETFSPLENHRNNGGTTSISTAVPGIHFAEYFPECARIANRLAVIRSMTSKEGSHPRASYLLHTGYLPNPSLRHPTLGSIVASHTSDDASDLPPVVRIGGRGRSDSGAGFLGTKWDPFELRSPNENPSHTTPAVSPDRHMRRLDLMERLEVAHESAAAIEISNHRNLYRRATRMMLSADMKAFGIASEPASIRSDYGSGEFASGCLMARRLIEHGVSFVEVVSNGWDTHQDNFSQIKNLAGQVDGPTAALVRDLESRGMLEKTLVLWMGEFGRTPQVNPRSGRDHFPRSYNVVLAGGGIQGGTVIGKTDSAGIDVTERPVTVPDLFATVCKSLSIDQTIEQLAPAGRPIKVTDGGSPVLEAFEG